jgi:hypothetical protein
MQLKLETALVVNAISNDLEEGLDDGDDDVTTVVTCQMFKKSREKQNGPIPSARSSQVRTIYAASNISGLTNQQVTWSTIGS